GDATEQADLAQQGGAVFLVELPRTRLGESVGRTQRERRKGMFGASYGEGGHDEYPGRRSQFDQRRNGMKPAHTGHVEVEKNDVGGAGQDRGDRPFRAFLGCYEAEIGFFSNQPGEYGANGRRVIDHQNAHWVNPLAAPVANRDVRRGAHVAADLGSADKLQLHLQGIVIERLHNVLVGARFDRLANVGDVVLGRAEHHFRAASAIEPAEFRNELDAIHHRHVPVEQDQVRHAFAAFVERIPAVLGYADLEFEAFDDVPRDLADHPRVIDDQAVFHAAIPVLWFSAVVTRKG